MTVYAGHMEKSHQLPRVYKYHTANSWFSLWEKKYSNEHRIAHFEYFFTCHYSKTVWLAENLSEIKIFWYQAKKVSFWERVGKRAERKHFFVSLRLSLFSPRHIALKLNQKIITKISSLPNMKYAPRTPRKSSFKRKYFQWI